MTSPDVPPDPEPVVDLTPDFLAAVQAVASGLDGLRADVKAQIAEESRRSDLQLAGEATIRAKSDRRYRTVVIVDILLSLLIGVGYGGLWRANHDQDVAKHRAAVAACVATDKVREGIRSAFVTDDSVWHSLIPKTPPPSAAVEKLIAGVDTRYAAAEAAVPEIDCSKVK